MRLLVLNNDNDDGGNNNDNGNGDAYVSSAEAKKELCTLIFQSRNTGIQQLCGAKTLYILSKARSFLALLSPPRAYTVGW